MGVTELVDHIYFVCVTKLLSEHTHIIATVYCKQPDKKFQPIALLSYISHNNVVYCVSDYMWLG